MSILGVLVSVLSSECQDLRIMNTAGDKKSSELRSEMQLLKASMEREISKLETDVNIFCLIAFISII